MDKTKLTFAADASQIDIKPMLQKEFLELSMRAISSANPNANNSWFTKESLEKGKETFKNKPILGYFENNDFVSHNGSWKNDPETDLDYWDTLGAKGERILGFIRAEDEVKIVEDEAGLSWICLTCVLWTQYSYKQVKRLLKDAKRAKENGGATKNISVEVDITDYEKLPNGIMKINDFNLVGITILGSRNGIKVEPGIEGAELSVIDITGNEFFAKQQNAIRLAYEKLKDNSKKEETIKEGYSQVIEQENNLQEEISVEQSSEAEAVVGENKVDAQFAEVCPECGETPCVCEKDGEEEENKDKECKMEEGDDDEEDDDEEEKECKMEEGDKEEDKEGDEPEQCAQMEAQSEAQSEEEAPQTEANAEENAQFSNGEAVAQLYDLSYLLDNIKRTVGACDEVLNYYSYMMEDPDSNYDYVSNVVKTIAKNSAEDLIFVTEAIANVAKGISFEEKEKASQLSAYSKIDLLNECNNLKAKFEEMNSKIEEINKKEFLEKANQVISSIKDLSEEQAKNYYNKCEAGEINSIDDLKIKIAVGVMFSEETQEVKEDPQPTVVESFSSPVDTPDTESFKKNDNEKKAKKTADKWTILGDYTAKNKE